MQVQATEYAIKNINYLYKQLPNTYFRGVAYPAVDLAGNDCKIRRTVKNGNVFMHIAYKTAKYIVNLSTSIVTVKG